MRETAKKNIKIHRWINFISGFVFLVPIVTLFYKYTGLSVFEIVIISNVYTFGIWIFELPTSVFADTTGRKKSLMAAVICNAISALLILIYPNFWSFAAASLFAALYLSFWSGTGQAFLEENLRLSESENKFGKEIGHMMFLGDLASLTTPLIAGAILKLFGESLGYPILAGLDVLFAILLIHLVTKLAETTPLRIKIKTVTQLIKENMETARQSIKNVYKNAKLRLFIVYRSLAHHTLFFPIVVLPLLAKNGMPDWVAGLVVSLVTISSMLASKFAYLFGEKYGYHRNWIIGTVAQGMLLIVAGFLSNTILPMIIIYICFNAFDGLWQPAWNHILVDLTKGKAIATTRSIVFSIFALYITIGKQILSLVEVQTALIAIGLFILVINLAMAKKVLKL
jgi:MFS family permease